MASHVILNVITQVQTTQLSHGSFDGHVISTAQVRLILDTLEQLDESDGAQLFTPDATTVRDDASSSDSTEAHQSELHRERTTLNQRLRRTENRLATASASERPRINEKRNTLLSRIAQIDRTLRRLR